MKEILKNKKILYIMIIGIIFIISISVSYAWFSRQISGNEDAKEMIVETGTLELLFEDGPEIEGKHISPSWTASKTFKVTNTGTLDTNYTIWWKDFENTIEKDELVYSLKCTSYSDYDTKTEAGMCYGFEDKIMNTADDLRILSNIAISSGYTHEYEVTLLFKETGSNQNYNQGKRFNGTINIKEYYENETDVPVVETYSTKDYILTAKATDNTGLVAYAVTYQTADLLPEDIEWINIKDTKELNLETQITNYKATLWVKSKNGNVGYADITPRPTLVVNSNGGIWQGTTGSQTYNMTYDETLEVSDPTFEGYTFLGWTVESEGTESTIVDGTFTMGESDTTLKAVYEVNKYKLTIDPNGGKYNDSSEPTVYEMDFNTDINVDVPVRTGYTFTGWNMGCTKADLNTDVLTIGAENCTLTASWQINDYLWIAYHNKMNLDGNGYTLIESDSGRANYGVKVTPGLKTYTGFKSPNSQNLIISDVEDNNVINYNYERLKNNLVINPNGGSYNGSTSNTTVSVYYEQQVNVLNPIRAGYNFTGWDKDGDGIISGTVFTGGTTETKLTANWNPINSTVTFNANGGGTPSFSTKSVTYDSTYGDLPSINRDGYEFVGWFTAASGGTEIKSSTMVEIISSQTLYAQWTPITYTIGYTLNGGTSGSSAPTSASYDTEITISNPTLKVTITGNANSSGATVGSATSGNKTFAGWTTNTNDGLENNALHGSNTADTSWTGSATKNTKFKNLRVKSGIVTLTATWIAKAISTPTLTKTGHECKWYDDSNCTGTAYTTSYTPSTTSMENNITLYAKCTPNNYTVTFNATTNGGSVSTTSKSVTYGSTYGSLPTASKSGYNFIGWFTAASGGTKVTASTIVNITKNQTLYAQYAYPLVDKILAAETAKSDSSITWSSRISTSQKGLYYISSPTYYEESNRIYYYRGGVTNNNVIFANKCWKIIRTTDSGGVKIIYSGTPTNNTCPTSLTASSTSTAYNTSNSDARYVGYMYGSSCTSYSTCHANSVNSNIKTYLDNWYKTNIYNANFDAYIDKNAIYCNDRTTYTNIAGTTSGGGYGTTNGYFGGFTRLENSGTPTHPTLKCTNTADKFSVNSGNKKLTYSIGLITADEGFYGGAWGTTSSSLSYLYNTSGWMLTMTPGYHASAGWRIMFLKTNGADGGAVRAHGLNSSGVATFPVTALSSTVMTSGGNGTTSTPYIIYYNK